MFVVAPAATCSSSCIAITAYILMIGANLCVTLACFSSGIDGFTLYIKLLSLSLSSVQRRSGLLWILPILVFSARQNVVNLASCYLGLVHPVTFSFILISIGFRVE